MIESPASPEAPGLFPGFSPSVPESWWEFGIRTLRMVLPQTCIPVPGTTDKVVLVSGTSPVLDLAAAFHDIFGAVTGTFRFA
ncbi:hypothetical protein ACFCYX_35045 [Streptomyces populi]|uniref:hypothetical protein n=1 Tax=Streptomyces populi TaxID=2058924 RepID=UPI0035DDFAE6